jgi:hypothetical protein
MGLCECILPRVVCGFFFFFALTDRAHPTQRKEETKMGAGGEEKEVCPVRKKKQVWKRNSTKGDGRALRKARGHVEFTHRRFPPPYPLHTTPQTQPSLLSLSLSLSFTMF